MMEERELLKLNAKLRGAGYGVDGLRREVLNVLFEAKGLSGEEMFERVTAIDDMFETLNGYIAQIKSVIDEEIDKLPKE